MMFVLLKRKHFGLRKGRGEERERKQKRAEGAVARGTVKQGQWVQGMQEIEAQS
jgi:hypothetical protein